MYILKNHESKIQRRNIFALHENNDIYMYTEWIQQVLGEGHSFSLSDINYSYCDDPNVYAIFFQKYW